MVYSGDKEIEGSDQPYTVIPTDDMRYNIPTPIGLKLCQRAFSKEKNKCCLGVSDFNGDKWFELKEAPDDSNGNESGESRAIMIDQDGNEIAKHERRDTDEFKYGILSAKNEEGAWKVAGTIRQAKVWSEENTDTEIFLFDPWVEPNEVIPTIEIQDMLPSFMIMPSQLKGDYYLCGDVGQENEYKFAEVFKEDVEKTGHSTLIIGANVDIAFCTAVALAYDDMFMEWYGYGVATE